MSKIKAVHSRFSYYITWGKEIGKCGGRKYEGERARVEGEQVLRVQNVWLGARRLRDSRIVILSEARNLCHSR